MFGLTGKYFLYYCLTKRRREGRKEEEKKGWKEGRKGNADNRINSLLWLELCNPKIQVIQLLKVIPFSTLLIILRGIQEQKFNKTCIFFQYSPEGPRERNPQKTGVVVERKRGCRVLREVWFPKKPEEKLEEKSLVGKSLKCFCSSSIPCPKRHAAKRPIATNDKGTPEHMNCQASAFSKLCSSSTSEWPQTNQKSMMNLVTC